MLFTAALLSSAALYANAHLCVWEPPQRGGAIMPETPGYHPCYLKDGPCGEMPSGEPAANLIGGSEFVIKFQQNLNHFYDKNPGSLVADFAVGPDPSEEDFSPLGQPIPDYNAMNMITQTNFTVSVTVPNVDCPHCVVRMRYISNNPKEDDRGTVFHQCSDVSVAKQDSVAAVDTHENAKLTRQFATDGGSCPPGQSYSCSGHFGACVCVEHSASASSVVEAATRDHSCCSADQFTMDGYETSSYRQPTQKKYFFDTSKQMFRIDTNSGSGVDVKDGYFQMFNNFTSGIEYYYNVNANTCDLYHCDLWDQWCYGAENQQTYAVSIKMGSETADVWRMEGTDFTWTNQRKECIPVGMNRATTGETTVFYNYEATAPAQTDFELPEACIQEERLMSDVKSLPRSPRTSIHHV